MAIVKTIKSARPTVSSATGDVVNWNVEITFTEGDFTRDYFYMKDVTDLNKCVESYTSDELLGFAPAVLDEVFAEHQRVSAPGYIPPTATKEVTFDKSGRAKIVTHDETVIVAPEKPHTFSGSNQ